MTVMAANVMVVEVRNASGETLRRNFTARSQNLMSDIPPNLEFVEDEIINTSSWGTGTKKDDYRLFHSSLSHFRRKSKNLIDTMDLSVKKYDDTFAFLFSFTGRLH